MSREPTSVPEIFRRAMALARENEGLSLRDLRRRLYDELKDSPMPPLSNLTFPEQDARAPEEDWTAGLPLVMRGIQQKDWKEVIGGIMLSLEQTENYERQRGTQGSADDWHDRTVGISGSTDKGVGKWMPAELMALAEKNVKKQ